jgi:hypothetical protein
VYLEERNKSNDEIFTKAKLPDALRSPYNYPKGISPSGCGRDRRATVYRTEFAVVALINSF